MLLQKNQRVVVTGMGAVSPLGVGVKNNWKKIVNGKSGIVKIPSDMFDGADMLKSKVAGIVPRGTAEGEFDVNEILSVKNQNKMDIFIHLALKASQEAIDDAGIKSLPNKDEIGVLVGSGIGGISSLSNNIKKIQETDLTRLSPFAIPMMIVNMVGGQIAIEYGFRGPNSAIATACASGTHSIGYAARTIASGDATIMVCGGAESAFTSVSVAGFCALRALSTSYNDTPEKSSRPWDTGRDGFVIAEGAATLVLEEYEHAKKRGANIYAEIVGYGMSGDGYHMTAPHPEGEGAYLSMKRAMETAEINTNEIDYINAHGTSTPLGDMMEISAIRKLFGDNIKDIPISSTKSATGHLLGASGALEAIFSIMAIKDGILPPTLNLENPESGTEDLNLVPNVAQKKVVNFALSNSFGFGGTNASIIFKKVS
ncbi:MAG: beta-ketoacyl-ACP synthase II [Alphaproteobacteria bacterium]|nr:beta-ketoacyl-ACP synthase II [Alphaproteobacteria bacterium]